MITFEQLSCSFTDTVPLASGDLKLVQQGLVQNVRKKGKNGIHIGNFQKNCIFPNIQLKGVVNRLPPFKNLSNHTNRFLMR